MMQDNMIYSTRNYEIFHRLCGNREVVDNRKNIIKQSIIENGYIRNPIVVNEKMEIIDGQGRLEALKELGLPVEYVISKGAGQKECVALNANQKNWKTYDYIKSFAEMNVPEYVFLKTACETFPNLDPAQITGICVSGQCTGGTASRIIKSGEMKFYNVNTIYERLKLYERIFNIVKGDAEFGLPRSYASVVTFLYECDEIDQERIVTNLAKYRQFVTPSFNTRQALRNLEFTYNRCAKKFVYFVPLYDKWNKGR